MTMTGSKTQGRHRETVLRGGTLSAQVANEIGRRRRAVGADGRGRATGVAVSSQSGEEKEEVWLAAVGEREDAENGCEGCAGGRREKQGAEEGRLLVAAMGAVGG
ncbi:hypothetical protein OIU74_025027 [Salix koriyanagi]|uniref:Uncharacterized protein n=1 Tax=Salix koriyanagi TaxID=2511006 RepID=A0A9Q0W825_9ROSI|nr:hypothetical protein OIU74_025027 [Salix koriyanagi]